MKTLFITGGTGFIGSHLLQYINSERIEKIYCLTRSLTSQTKNLSLYPNVTWCKGDIFDLDKYKRYLALSDIVVHLAAVTGKAQKEEYFRVNAEGTEFLIKHCENLGVTNFLYVSSIATKFPDISRYYYAQSKKHGEDVVRQSNLNYTIVRPTIVISHKSPIWQNLSKLARAPIPMVFGDGKAKLQPIFINDLIHCILTVLNQETFINEEFDLGGPDVVSFEDFLRMIRIKNSGKDARVVHIPLQSLTSLLSILEKRFYSFLPMNVGQLSPFKNDSTIEQNRLFNLHEPQMKNIESMLKIVLDHEKENESENKLADECSVFSKYLINQNPNDYVQKKYLEAHIKGHLEAKLRSSPFNRLLISFAGISPLSTRLADTYTRTFFKRSLLRKKLTLLLAILESCAPYYTYLDETDSCAKPLLYFKLFISLLSSTLTLAVAILFLAPIHTVCTITSKTES